ncbi:ssrA-binding protein [Firmicutes bacterium CAG:449]|nr:ssrA-binding protein [Firmicutes bacterium CAG:449]
MEDTKIVVNNKKAHYEYFLSDFLECGIALKGTEIKSLRKNGGSLNDAYIICKNGEMFLLNMNIPPYDKGNIFNHDQLRTRKLLLHKQEIYKYAKKVQEKGFTIVPTKVYLLKGRAKVEIALAKGKKLFDKRETEKTKSIKKEVDSSIKNHNRY